MRLFYEGEVYVFVLMILGKNYGELYVYEFCVVSFFLLVILNFYFYVLWLEKVWIYYLLNVIYFFENKIYIFK